jgi:hypothetical protein
LFLWREFFGMTDYFALLQKERRPWLDPEELKETYFALSRVAAPDARLNEAYRVLNDPKLRLHHLLSLEHVDLAAGRPVPPSVADLFWNTGAVLREAERWLIQNAGTTTALQRSLAAAERTTLHGRISEVDAQLRPTYESRLEQLRQLDATWKAASPNVPQLLELYDSIAYLTRLLEQIAEKKFQLDVA